MADDSAVRLVGVAPGARPADGVLHRQPRHHLPVSVRKLGHPQHDAVAHLSVHDRLPAFGRAPVHLHGGDAGEGRHHRGAVRRGLQVARLGEGRPRGRDRAGLHGASRYGRRRRRHRSDHGHDRATRYAQAWLRPKACLRLVARRRHARHSHPALGDGDRLRGGGAAIARRVTGRFDFSGFAVVRTLRLLRSHPLLHQSEARPGIAARRARRLARKAAAVEKHDRANPADHPGARRDLRRHRHAGGGGRHRHLRRVVRLGAAPAADLAGGPGGGNCNVEGHRHGDVDFLRRHHVRRLLHRKGRTDLRRRIRSSAPGCRPTAF